MIGVTVGNGGNGLRGRATGTDALYQGLPIATMDRCAWIGRASSAVFSDQLIQQDLSSYAIRALYGRGTPYLNTDAKQDETSCKHQGMVVQLPQGRNGVKNAAGKVVGHAGPLGHAPLALGGHPLASCWSVMASSLTPIRTATEWHSTVPSRCAPCLVCDAHGGMTAPPMSMHAYNAFMASLQEMGLDCSNWSPSVYHDLLRCGDGSAEGLLRAFFDTVSRRNMTFTPETAALSC